jgi:ActR/RegA family two-component response regulator
MAKIIIVDDNRSMGAFLKKALEYEAHQVILVPHEQDAIVSFRVCGANLVMINQSCRQHSGWTIFNHLKHINSQMPLMLYVLDNYRPAGTAWVIQALNETLSCLQKIRPKKEVARPAKIIAGSGAGTVSSA